MRNTPQASESKREELCVNNQFPWPWKRTRLEGPAESRAVSQELRTRRLKNSMVRAKRSDRWLPQSAKPRGEVWPAPGAGLPWGASQQPHPGSSLGS